MSQSWPVVQEEFTKEAIAHDRHKAALSTFACWRVRGNEGLVKCESNFKQESDRAGF